jgi:biopolymer transport protein ExbD
MHVAGNKKGRKKNLNFELNLVPFIDVLSTCICFLLVTAVFINLGSFHVSQAVGSEKNQQSEKPQGTVTVSLGGRGDIRFQVKDVKGLGKSDALVTIKGDTQGNVNFKRTEEWIKSFASRFSDVKTVLLMPNPSSKYDDLIQLMAQFKASSMDQIGIAPL